MPPPPVTLHCIRLHPEIEGRWHRAVKGYLAELVAASDKTDEAKLLLLAKAVHAIKCAGGEPPQAIGMDSVLAVIEAIWKILETVNKEGSHYLANPSASKFIVLMTISDLLGDYRMSVCKYLNNQERLGTHGESWSREISWGIDRMWAERLGPVCDKIVKRLEGTDFNKEDCVRRVGHNGLSKYEIRTDPLSTTT